MSMKMALKGIPVKIDLREIRARKEDDIMTALALYRPGPLVGRGLVFSWTL